MAKQTLSLMKLVLAEVAAAGRAQVSLSPDHERPKVKNEFRCSGGKVPRGL